MSRRALLCAGAAVSLGATVSIASRAQDAATAKRELAESPDFRVRVTAALVLGKTRPPGARAALEAALSDAHPAVRVAAAAALATLGDAAAVAALERRRAAEPSASVKAQIQSSIDQLKKGVEASQPTPPPPPPASSAEPKRELSPATKYVVKIGTMRNSTAVRGEELQRVLHDAARSRVRALKGAFVVESDALLIAQAQARRLPILTLDGSITSIDESSAGGAVQIQARVEFAVKREQTLKGMLTGAATTFGTTQTLSDQGRRRMQDDAVDGAVQSALRGADQGLLRAVL